MSEVTGFLYGSMSTRFWMQRQGVLDLVMKHRFKDVPFYAWECITIQLRKRDVDLVIHDEIDMQILIKFLIVYLNSFDSNKNSIQILKNFKLIKKGVSALSMMNCVYLGYMIMKIRMKISFEACIRRRTVQEHFFESILSSYN